MNIIGFKAWYADGSVDSSSDWYALPADNIQIVMTYFHECFDADKRYRCMDDGCDWYWFYGTGIQTVRSKAFGWQLKPDEQFVKRGTMISDAEFKRIADLAYEDL